MPLNETTELYQFTAEDGGTTTRVAAELTSATYTYTAAQQTADGRTPGDPVTVKISQKSEIVGYGDEHIIVL